MEPIELSGKTFCSNCGLTVGNVPPRDPIAQVTSSFGTKEDNSVNLSQTTPSSPVLPAVMPSSPIKDSAAEQLGITTAPVLENQIQPTVGAIIDSPAELGAVKIRVNNEGAASGDIVVADTNDDSLADTTEPPKQIFEEKMNLDLTLDGVSIEKPNEEGTVNQEALVEEDEKPLLGQILDTPTISEPSTPKRETTLDQPTSANLSIEEKVKEVDTLGASGILLDILNENFQADARENDLHALEAAEELIDRVEISPSVNQSDSKADENLHFGVLEDQPQNPVEYPELPSPYDELEIEAPNDNSKLLETPESQTAVASDSEGILTQEQTSTKDPTTDDLYKLPHELEKIPNPHSPEELSESIQAVEENLSHLDNTKVDESILHSHYYDPDTIAPLVESEAQPQSIEVPTSDNNPNLKQEVVKTFFKEKVEKPKKKLAFWEKPKKKKKTKPAKIKKNEKENTQNKPKEAVTKENSHKKFIINFDKKWLLYPLLGILTVILGLTVYFTYQNYQLPTEQEARTAEAAQTLDFESKIPNEIPAGYEMTGSNFDDGENQLLIRYDFANDDTKTLIYKQKTITSTPQESVAAYVKSKEGESYVVKEQNGTSFTEFSNGTLVWTSGEFLFTIEAQGYDLSHDLLYKMALSLG